MGSKIEINDSLVITREQGFPAELSIEKHLVNPFQTEDFIDRIFEFKNKQDIRIYQAPPVRIFLVEKNSEGKWLYWGLIHMLEVTTDYEHKMTSGKFKIIHINTPEQMKQAHNLIDRNDRTSYFS